MCFIAESTDGKLRSLVFISQSDILLCDFPQSFLIFIDRSFHSHFLLCLI
jgi:hypothetical protein